MTACDDNNLYSYSLAGTAHASASGVFAVLADTRVFADAAQLGETVTYRLMVVVEELATNIVSHGQPAPGTTIDYCFERCPDGVRITMADSGIPFDPGDLPQRPQTASIANQPEGGIGWPLILQWCRLEECSRTGDRNRVTLVLETGP